MKKIIIGAFVLGSFVSNAQLNLKSIKEKAKTTVEATKKTPLSNDEIVSGLKEALNVGIDNDVGLYPQLSSKPSEMINWKYLDQ